MLTYPAYSEDGTERPPSPYLEETIAALADLEPLRVPLSRIYAPPAEAVREADLLPIVADGLARAPLGHARVAAALYDRGAVDRAELARSRRLELLRALPIPGFPKDPAAALSASGINDFQRCPYLFFARKVLRVEPARPQALDPLMRGNIVHKVLERCALEGGDPGKIFDEVFDESVRNAPSDRAPRKSPPCQS